MLKPFYQGKLDTFCAIYAVLNALKLTHGIRTVRARDILNDTLLNLSLNTENFKKFLNQDTDYLNLVDDLLNYVKTIMPLEIVYPYKMSDSPTNNDLWNKFSIWFGECPQSSQSRAIIFRFLRYINPSTPPLNKHWTTADYLKNDILHLFDCSHEAEAILNIKKNTFVTNQDSIDSDHLLFIQPHTIRFIKLPF